MVRPSFSQIMDMRKYIISILLLSVTTMAMAQETHYHKGLRTQEENSNYGGVGAEPNFNGGGTYWSRARNVDDVAITHETREDSIARQEEFKRLCQLAYDAFNASDAIKTIVFGDSALMTRYHTPELYIYMAISYEKLGNDKDAAWAYRKAIDSGYPGSTAIYKGFKKRMKERKAEAKHKKKKTTD